MDLYREETNEKLFDLKMFLTIPPSVNKIYYNDKKGGRRLTGHSERYIRDTRSYVRAIMEDNKLEKVEGDKWLYMDLIFYFPDRRIRDSHNCLKILLDALEGVVFHNDYYICPRIQSVEYDKENPGVHVHFHNQTIDERKSIIG